MPHFPALTNRVSKGTLRIYYSDIGYVVGFRFLETSYRRSRVCLLYAGGEMGGKERGLEDVALFLMPVPIVRRCEATELRVLWI
jgi:hypothetical protein